MTRAKTQIQNKPLTTSPWGHVDYYEIWAPGIIFVATPSHGGVWLSPERREKISYTKNWLKTTEWWEEDCDWAIPFLVFAEDIKADGGYNQARFEKSIVNAQATVKACHPEFAKSIGLI